jgi:hypothetical protein
MPGVRPGPHRQAVQALCVMRWGGIDYVTRFHPDGRYEADSGSALWVGEWSLSRNGGSEVLTVRERPSGPQGGGWFRFEITLDTGRRKGVHPDAHFSLRDCP